MAVKFPLQNLRQSINGTWQQIFATETVTVPSSGELVVSLEEVPDNGTVNGRVTITGLTESLTYPPISGKFFVNYTNGKIAFNSAQTGQTLSVNYWKKGSLVEAEDINWLYDRVSTNFTSNYVISATAPDEPFTGQQWFNTTDGIIYTRDIRDKWISINRETVVFGRKDPTQNQYLNYYVSQLASNLSGLRVIRNACITGISVQISSLAPCTFQIRKNGSGTPLNSYLLDGSIGGGDTSLDINLSEGDILQAYLSSDIIVENPIIMIEFAWRQ